MIKVVINHVTGQVEKIELPPSDKDSVAENRGLPENATFQELEPEPVTSIFHM